MEQIGDGIAPLTPPSGPGFRSKFGELFRDILPVEVRDALRDAAAAGGAAPQLNVFFRGATEWIPWELMHDGKQYLGVRFAVSRMPIVAQATGVRPPRNRDVRKVYNILANHILQDNALTNWQTTFAIHAKNAGWEARFPSNGGGNYPTVSRLDEAVSADILHVTCHGGLRENPESGDYYWTLDHKSPQAIDYRITPDIARQFGLTERPLVFANACASAKQPTDLAALQSFGPNFMIGGALNFVGTFAPITKTMAVEFARRFYARLFGSAAKPGLPIAEALRATKESFAVENCTDPSYLFYCLYGPADSTYQPV
jgi:CHAT domain-containing protein